MAAEVPLSCPAVSCCQNCCTTACLPNCMCKHKRLAIHPAGGADTVGEVIQTYPGCCRWVHSCGLCICHSGLLPGMGPGCCESCRPTQDAAVGGFPALRAAGDNSVRCIGGRAAGSCPVLEVFVSLTWQQYGSVHLQAGCPMVWEHAACAWSGLLQDHVVGTPLPMHLGKLHQQAVVPS